MKNPLFSKTLQGILLLLLPRLLKKCGLEFSDAETQSLVELLCDCLGGAWATYGRFTAETPLRNPIARKIKGVGLLCCLLSAFLFFGTGCAALQDKWDGLSPATQTALENGAKLAAKAALSIGLAELGDNVKELRPYTQKLTPLFETTFSTATDPATIGSALAAHVQAVVPAEHQATVATALKDALAKPSATTAAGAGPSAFNRALAAKL